MTILYERMKSVIKTRGFLRLLAVADDARTRRLVESVVEDIPSSFGAGTSIQQLANAAGWKLGTAMPIWKPRSVTELPKIPLSRWRILETEDGSRHFVGVDMFDSSGRVSSPIATFDPATLLGTTQTGRIYELVGRKGSSLDVEYVWMRWCELYEVTSYIDVTELVLAGAGDDDPT